MLDALLANTTKTGEDAWTGRYPLITKSAPYYSTTGTADWLD